MIDARWRPVLGYLLLISVAVLALWLGRGLAFGRVAQIGPGFFPTVISISLIALATFGALTEVARLRLSPDPDEVESGDWPLPVDWVSLATIPAAVLAFAITVRPLGLVPAVVLCFVIASLADGRSRWRLVLPLSAAAAAVCWLIFVQLLAMPIRPWRWPF
ncbi:tripartite tricarboxylate transporter TctB family protein [Phaeovulum sp. NW3]|uniref:tripartite tricarboxylate transporter TctB family protein n=1 Tax=Phaeovulum sp. NW3 TaxID=2934933 RepID=UPI00202288C0|nr:tripartite tricarboxylate transporter TctB family protein [Phaeovulum sp. NW3]MCL7466625.1 tripartite tricarboxylate transporter TctB family protein [Phaeovulum sp. NW3]